jgi:outer membrane protein TolC
MKKIKLFLFTMLMAYGASKAQTVYDLTLEEAVKLAKQHRSAYLLANKDVKASTLVTRESRAGFAPTLTLDADIRYNAILATSIVPNFGGANPSEKIPLQFGTPFQSTVGVTLKQNLLNPTLKPSIQASQVREQIAENAKTKSYSDLVEMVSVSYYQVLLYETAIQYSTVSFTRWESLWKQLELRMGEGRALPTEVNTAFINKENARLTLQQDQQNAMLSKQYLLLQIGLDSISASSIKLSNDLAGLYTDSGKLTDSVNVAARPEFKEAKLNEELAVWNSKREARGILPTLSFVGYLGAGGFGDKDNSILNVSDNWFGSSYLGLQLSMPFLDFTRSSRVETQRINREKAVIQQTQWKNQIQYEVAQARLKTIQAQDAIAVRKKNLDVADQNEKTIAIRFSEGRALLTDVLDAETLLEQSRQQFLQAIYDYLNATISYRKAIGELH